jgi:hypothetical protein
MTSTRSTPGKGRPAAPDSTDGLLSLMNPLFEAQRAPWEAWMSWQQSWVKFNQDCWEQWAVRCAGGIPLDG